MDLSNGNMVSTNSELLTNSSEPTHLLEILRQQPQLVLEQQLGPWPGLEPIQHRI